MKKTLKIRLLIFTALMVAFVASLGAILGIGIANADRTVTVNGSSIFIAGGDADVWASGRSGETDNKHYTMFHFASEDDSISYRRNLAYKWFYNSIEESKEEGTDTQADDKAPSKMEKADGLFNMEIGFDSTNFKRYIITFESQQYYQTKDSKSTNYIIFVPVKDGDSARVNVIITDDKDAEVENETQLSLNHIKIEFTGANGGEYGVKVSNGSAVVEGAFKNVGGNYAKSSTSTSNPVTPLGFSAEFEEEGAKDARMILYTLNGQSFEISNPALAGDHYTGSQINDITPPVLCLDKGVSFIEEGEEISFNYTVIDVLTSSPSMTTAYFMLDKEQAATSDFNASDCAADNLFTTVKADDDQYMIPHVQHYIPTSADYNGNVFDEDFKVTAAVKVYLKLTDTTASNGQTTYVLLDWYVEPDYLVKVNGNNYIAVATDKVGVTYSYANGNEYVNPAENEAWQNAVKEYQAKVDEAAKDLKAGSKNYFYLPSFENLLSDNATKYSDLTYTVYYNNGSQSTVSNKAASALSITLSKAGEYVFTIYATDAAGNHMFYIDKDGKKVEFSGSTEVWNMYKDEDGEGLRDYLPWFRFNVGVSEISVEDPGEQKTAYVGTKYDSISFDINGVSYDTSYKLYRFENSMYFKDNKASLKYDEFMDKKEQLFTENRNYFTEIYALADMSEGDDEYELYKDYEWNNSSLSFIPQEDNGFYLIVCKVTSTENGKQQGTAYMGISASIKPAPIDGDNHWLEDNLVSVILLSIAGAALIGLILLFVIKPKNKDVDAEFEAEANKADSKKKSK